MKKKLITGLALVLLIFTIGSMVVIQNLNTIVANQNLINEQDMIITMYNEMLFQMKGAQAELYRHQAGYTRNIDDLIRYIEEFDANLEFLPKKYSSHLHDVACMQCHSQIEERLTSLSGILSGIEKLEKDYKEDVSILITTNDAIQIKLVEDAATQKGITMIGLLEKARHAADKMRSEIKSKRNILITRSRTLIFTSIFVTIVSSLIVLMVIIRGVTGSVNSLIKGIQTIASGDFSKRVRVDTKDEIGFMAEAFNNMTAKLSAMNEEKDKLLDALKGFNEELEKRVKEATDKLRLTQESMVRAETLAAIGTMAAGVSHEMSTPLNTVLGFTQLINSQIDGDDPVKKDLKVIEQEILRCKRIVQGLLEFARTSVHEEKILDINSVINETLTLINYQHSMRKIVVKRNLDKDLASVEADPANLKQVLLNLFLNAVQAMPDGGELKIITKNTGTGVEITIADTGTGIPNDALQKIFQPFYTTKKDGTGLGLSITYGIVKDHGGDIYVDSVPGKGTTFRIIFPSRSMLAGKTDSSLRSE
ncbi:MAG: HAMP domain-containing protein [Nitrospiraceae bacterium]|nr:MAG: HAMP domain-containing protein [Nitrospiraceae bacterium]